MYKYTCMTLIGILCAAAVAWAQAGDTPFQVRYATNLQVNDARIYMTNTGANATTITPINGNICANVYAFTPTEQLVDCCSCLITPNGLAALSVWNDFLHGAPLNPSRSPDTLVFKLLASLGTTTVSSCDAGRVGDGTHPIVPGLAAWGTSTESSNFPDSPPLMTATPFTPATLSAAELGSLNTQCLSLHSTSHRCPSC